MTSKGSDSKAKEVQQIFSDYFLEQLWKDFLFSNPKELRTPNDE